ncbi:MAG TPA: extracellular solute-binding protein [Thermoanaerobaculia bacterium]|jgi:arabinogalactan oligomer/maltooligosaccharide transport system substrate-binding protein|nr:extracellular solute-binding protein [Thermoanaerobaculia bacterium]
MPRRIAILLLLSLFAVPGWAQEERKEIVVWHSYQGAARMAFEKVVDGFRSKEGWTATPVAVPPDLLPSRIASQVPRGEGPDVFLSTQERMGSWVQAGHILEPLLPVDSIRARFLPGTLEALTYQRKIYGLPLEFRVITLIYNRNLLQDAPLSSREMVAQARRLTSPELGKFGLATWYTDPYYHAPLLNAFGGSLFGPDGRPTINSAANVQSAQLLKGWLRQGFLPSPSTTLITSLFNEGKLAMVIAGPSFVERIAPSIPFALGPLPSVEEAGGKPMRPWITVQAVHIAATSRHKDVAAKLVRYLTDVPAARTLALEGRLLPAHAAAYRDPQLSGDPVLQGFRRQLDAAVPMPNVPDMSRIWGPLARALDAVVERRSTPQAALDQAQKEMTAVQ